MGVNNAGSKFRTKNICRVKEYSEAQMQLHGLGKFGHDVAFQLHSGAHTEMCKDMFDVLRGNCGV